MPGEFAKIRETLDQERPLSSESPDATRLRRWFFSDYLSRTVSPWSSQSVSDYLEQLIRSHNADDLDAALGTSPGNPRLLAISAERSKDKQLSGYYCRLASALLVKQTDVASRAEVLYHLALAQRANNDRDGAASTLAEAIQLQPKRSDFLVTRAEWLLVEGQNEEGLIVCDQAVRLDPNNPITLYERAWQYAKSGVKIAAIDDFQAASEREAASGKPATIEPAMRKRNGWTLLELGKPDLAVRQFLQVVQTTNVRERDSVLGLIIAYWQNDQTADAIGEYRDLVASYPALVRAEAIADLNLDTANQAILDQVRVAATAEPKGEE